MDNSEKPFYHALKSLIYGEWETHEQLVTDDDGYVTFTGFKSEYALTVDGKEATITLSRDTPDALTFSR